MSVDLWSKERTLSLHLVNHAHPLLDVYKKQVEFSSIPVTPELAKVSMGLLFCRPAVVGVILHSHKGRERQRSEISRLLLIKNNLTHSSWEVGIFKM